MQNFVLQRFATFLIKKINKIFLYVKKTLSLQRTQTILPMLDYTIPTIFFAVSLAVAVMRRACLWKWQVYKG